MGFHFDDPAWPGLTFNPAKGDLHTIESLAYDVKTVGDELDEMRELLVGIGKTDGVWDGEAAKKFQDKVGELPKYLKQGHESMTACSKALRAWHDELETMQRQAKNLEAEAVEARSRLAQRNDAVSQANNRTSQAMIGGIDAQQLKALSDEANAASSAAKEAAADVDFIIKKGESLFQCWQEEAAKAEQAIREAAKNRPPDIGVWDKFTDGLKRSWDNIKDFLADNADLFSTVGSVLSIMSLATMGVPIVGAAFGVLAIGASALALAGYGARAARGDKVGVMDLAGAAIGLVPVGGAIRGLRAAKPAAAAAKAGTRMAGVFSHADELRTSVNVARGMADTVTYRGLVSAGQKLGLSKKALDVGSPTMITAQAGIKGLQLGRGLLSDKSSTGTASAPSSNAFMSAAGAA